MDVGHRAVGRITTHIDFAVVPGVITDMGGQGANATAAQVISPQQRILCGRFAVGGDDPAIVVCRATDA